MSKDKIKDDAKKRVREETESAQRSDTRSREPQGPWASAIVSSRFCRSSSVMLPRISMCASTARIKGSPGFKKNEYGKGPFRAERLDDGWRTVLRKSIANRISPAIPFRLAILLCKAKLNRSASAPGLTERVDSFLGAGHSGFRERRS